MRDFPVGARQWPAHLTLGWATMLANGRRPVPQSGIETHLFTYTWPPRLCTLMSQISSISSGKPPDSFGHIRTQRHHRPMVPIILGVFESTGFTMTPPRWPLGSKASTLTPATSPVPALESYSANVCPITYSHSLPAHSAPHSPPSQAVGLGGREGVCPVWPSRGVCPVMSASSRSRLYLGSLHMCL